MGGCSIAPRRDGSLRGSICRPRLPSAGSDGGAVGFNGTALGGGGNPGVARGGAVGSATAGCGGGAGFEPGGGGGGFVDEWPGGRTGAGGRAIGGAGGRLPAALPPLGGKGLDAIGGAGRTGAEEVGSIRTASFWGSLRSAMTGINSRSRFREQKPTCLKPRSDCQSSIRPSKQIVAARPTDFSPNELTNRRRFGQDHPGVNLGCVRFGPRDERLIDEQL